MRKLIGLLLLLASSVQAGTVTFSNPNSVSTTATFTSSGTYVLKFTASDSALSTSGTINVTVTLPVTAGLAMDAPTGIGGNTVNTNVSFSTGSIPIAGLQFTVGLPVGVTVTTGAVITGPASLSAGKSATASVTGSSLTVIVFGLNQNAINTGVVAVIPLSLGVSLPTGTVPLALSALNATDVNGNSVTMTGTNGTLSVTANKPPVVNSIVGPTSVVLPSSATYSATATDDGAPTPPGTLNFQWAGQ